MANYMCIRVVARPVKGAEEDFKRLCATVEDPDEFIESIESDAERLWVDIDYEPNYDDKSANFELIAKYNYPRYELEDGFGDNYVVDYDIVFADESEDYNIDYRSNDPDVILQEIGCIGVYKKRRIANENPEGGYDYKEKYFFPQNDEEKHLMYWYSWPESYIGDSVDRQKLYHTNPDDPDDEFYDNREEMDLKAFFNKYEI